MADEKSSEVKKNEREEGASLEEHRQSAMEPLGQTVKRHFEHFDHSHFLNLFTWETRRPQQASASGFEINGCPVVPDNQNYVGATKLC